jgi:hypothetical protein
MGILNEKRCKLIIYPEKNHIMGLFIVKELINSAYEK